MSMPLSDAAQRKWSTPQWIRVLTGTAALTAVVLGLVVGSVLTTVRDGLAVIGGQAAPQVSATTDLYFAFSDLDAQLANVLLVGNDPALAANRKLAMDLYEQRRTQADADLQQIATDPSAKQAVRSVLDQYGRFEFLAAQVIQLDQRENSPAGRPSQTLLDIHRQATDVMRQALKSVQGLTDTNHDLLTTTYQSDLDGISSARAWVIVIGLALVLLLLAVQVYLRKALRRRLNPALIVATLMAAGLTITGTALLSTEANHLTVAKSNAFDSIIALSRARAVSYDANADESRYLVDPARAGQYEQAFVDKSHLLDRYFQTELANITFPGELAAAQHTVDAYRVYQNDDKRIRRLATGNELLSAIALNIGTTPNTSNYDFGQYDKALQSVIDVNQQAFEQAIGDGQSELDGWTGIIPAVLVLLMIGLIAVGVWPRLAEYR